MTLHVTGRLAAVAAVAGLMIALWTTAPARAAQDVIGGMQSYTTKYEDDLLDVSRRYGLGVIELMAANPGVDPWLPGANVRLTVPTMHVLPAAAKKGIVINTAELRMYYYPQNGEMRTFPLGVGREGYLTPRGQTTIVRKGEKPNWYLTPSEIKDHPELPPVIPPGPENPLGDYALYLGWPAYLVHGTNNAYGIGRRASRGCIRMYPEDIEWLYPKVPVGTPVTVVDQPVKIGRRDGELFLEVHPSVRQVDTMEETSKSPAPPEPIDVAEWADRILGEAGKDIDRLDWAVIERSLAERPGYPVQVTKPIGAQAMTSPSAPMAPPPMTPAPAKPFAGSGPGASSTMAIPTPPTPARPLPDLDSPWARPVDSTSQRFGPLAPPQLPRSASPPASAPTPSGPTPLGR